MPSLSSAAVPARPPEDDPAAIWRRVRAELEASLPAATFDLWLEPLRAVGSSAETLYLTGPARIRTWVERRYLDQLEAALQRVGSHLERIALVDTEPRGKGGRAERPIAEPLPIDPRHTFDRFVIGPGSRFAHAAALAVAELPGEAYNPLFLHGPPGLGKTHLLGAIAGYYRDHHPQLTFHYTTAERFTSEFVAALRTEGPERFKERYRRLDALLIDDVQILEGKPRTEEEFVHTFNALFAAGKQIVLSSDRPPGSLERLEQRLRDRFEWGLAVEVEPPDLRTRVALLWRFAGDAVDQLPEPDVLRTIATRVPGNVRRLEGALTRVLAVSSVFDEPLAGPALTRALPVSEGRAETDVSLTAPTVATIQEAVSSVLGVPREALLSKQRTPRVTRARQLAMFLARELTPLSLAQIAREFDRDHSTVLHALKVVAQRNEPGSDYAGDIHSVRAALGKLESGYSGTGAQSDPDSDRPRT
jgi:chromosomal replication initiator protein